MPSYGVVWQRDTSLGCSSDDEGSAVADPGFMKGGGGQSIPLGGSGGMLPQKIVEFQVVSGAF